MTKVNLNQLRSANPLDTSVDGCDKKIVVANSLDNAGHTNECLDMNTSNDVPRLKEENETQGKRIEELTLYIQQATQGEIMWKWVLIKSGVYTCCNMVDCSRSYQYHFFSDREQIIHQYTSYSQQLTAQIETLTNSLNETQIKNHNLACR